MDRTERVGFWLTSKEKHLLTCLAEIEGGLTQAALLRRLIHLAANEYGIDQPEVEWNSPHDLREVSME